MEDFFQTQVTPIISQYLPYIKLFLASTLCLVAYIMHETYNFKINKIKDNIKDPNEDVVKKQVDEIKRLNALPWPEYKKIMPNTFKSTESLKEKLRSDLSKIPKAVPLNWNEFILFSPPNRLEQIYTSEKLNEFIVNNLKSLNDSWPNEYEIKHNFYLINDPAYKIIDETTTQWEHAKYLFTCVDREIQEAQSAISSASMVEVVDLFTTNKVVSAISSYSTYSADSEIKEILPSLRNLSSHLKSIELREKDLMNKTSGSIPHDNLSNNLLNIEGVDLFSDLFLNFSFDFTSIFSIISLSSASGDLNELVRKLTPVEDKINNMTLKNQSIKKEYFNQLT